MSTYIGIGFSKNPNTLKAAEEAATIAKGNLQSSQIDIAIVLSTTHYHPEEFIPYLYHQLKKPRLIGSSTAAILVHEHFETRGIAILLMYSDEIRFETSSQDNIHLRDPDAAGSQLAQNCLTDYGVEHRKLFLIFADSLIERLSRFVGGVSKSLDSAFPIIGAGSSDDFQFKKSFQYYNDQVLSFGSCAVLFGGRIQVGLGCRHGWRPLGKPRIINQSETNMIKMIDQKPAAQIYQEYFDNTEKILQADSLARLNTRYPLGTPLGKNREYLLRNIINTLEDDSLIVQDGMAEGARIHLMIGNKETCLQAAQQAAQDAKKQMQGRKPKLIIIIESLSRYRILGRATNTEIQQIRQILGMDVPVIGMYSFGEIFTHLTPKGPETLLQNESIIITAIC